MASVTNPRSDWGTRGSANVPTKTELALLRCPFEVVLPEIRRRESTWEAFRVARPALNVTNPTELIASRGPTPQSKQTSHAPSIQSKVEQDDEMPAPVDRSSKSEHERPRKPRATGDDPFRLEDLMVGPPGGDANIGLEGIPPDRFEGDKARSMAFLTRFKGFMIMNRNASIARDPFKKCAYFLSLIGGPKVDGWVQRNYDWPDKVKRDTSHLRVPFGMTPWEALEADFKRSFIDPAEHKRAQDELRKLKMKEGNVDEYIATFELLTHRAGMDLDDPTALRLFARRLPRNLADSCIENPENFEQWVKAAQQHQRNRLRKPSDPAQVQLATRRCAPANELRLHVCV
jgi:Retrotransposon gag protein